MKLNISKRLIVEDFDKEDQALIQKLAFTLNSTFEQMAQAFSKNITIDDNLNMEVKEVVLTVDAGGLPTTQAAFQSSLKTKVRGIIVLRAFNQTNPSTYPTGAPFVSFEQNNNVVTIQHVTGLQAAESYKLQILSLG